MKRWKCSNIILNEVILKYGFFTDMTWVSDFGPEFRADVTRELFKMCGIKHRIITCYHPQSNSIVEKINSTVLTLLRKYAQDQTKSWVTLLRYATFIYNKYSSSVDTRDTAKSFTWNSDNKSITS